MSLRRLLSVSIVFIATVACGVAASMAVRQDAAPSEADQGASRFAALRAVLDISNQMNGERGLTTQSRALGDELTRFLVTIRAA